MTNPSAVCLLPSVVAGNSRLDYWTIRGYVVAAVDEPAGGFYVPGFAFFTRREVTRSRKCLGRCLPGGLVRVSPQTRCSLAGAARAALPPTRRGPLNRPHRATARGPRRDRIIVRSECGSCARSRSRPGLPGRQGLSFGCGCRTSRRLLACPARVLTSSREGPGGLAFGSGRCLPGGPGRDPRTMLPGGCGPRRVAPVRRAGRSTAYPAQ